MTMLLRTVLVLACVLTTLLIMRKIRQSKMRIEDSVFWIGFSFMLILFSVFPQLVYLMSDMVGTQTPVNFIFLFVIFVLIIRMFRLTVKLSHLETKMRELVQRIAIEENLRTNGVSGTGGSPGMDAAPHKDRMNPENTVCCHENAGFYENVTKSRE